MRFFFFSGSPDDFFSVSCDKMYALSVKSNIFDATLAHSDDKQMKFFSFFSSFPDESDFRECLDLGQQNSSELSS